MVAAAFGLSAIIAISATAFVWIKWLGVAYLAWIGFQLIVSKETVQDIQASKGDTAFRLYRQGVFTSMANPFAVVFLELFFLNLSISLTPYSRSDLFLQQLIL